MVQGKLLTVSLLQIAESAKVKLCFVKYTGKPFL